VRRQSETSTALSAAGKSTNVLEAFDNVGRSFSSGPVMLSQKAVSPLRSATAVHIAPGTIRFGVRTSPENEQINLTLAFRDRNWIILSADQTSSNNRCPHGVRRQSETSTAL